MQVAIDTTRLESYRTFLQIKSLPQYRIRGGFAEFPDEYAKTIGLDPSSNGKDVRYQAPRWMFDYQRAITRMAIIKRKFCIFADCGLGKTPMFLEFAQHAAASLPPGKCILIVSPLMVVSQTVAEARKFYGDGIPLRQVRAKELAGWLQNPDTRIGITNYDSLTDGIEQGELGCLILDESSMLKSHYGKWGQACLNLGKGLEWKMACTGTPAPNDRIEYANHAVFMDAFPTVNSFLAKFFVNKGQTNERWIIKPHAIEQFYKTLSHWCIFLTNPGTYGWKDNTENIPPIHVHVHPVPLTPEQQALAYSQTGSLLCDQAGGITSRSVLSQIAKGNYKGKAIPSNKAAYIRKLVDSWPGESTLIWCLYNEEQATMERTFPGAASITGETPLHDRQRMIDEFKAGTIKVMISKPKILGLGLNLQIATRQVFSGLQDSYESYYQAVKRSNRIGSKLPLNVHIPITDIERPMIETVLAKAKRVQEDTEQQERIFKDATRR